MTLSRVERVLTGYVRGYLKDNIDNEKLRKVSFAMSLITCLLDGSVSLFPLFALSFTNNIGLTAFENNLIASSMMIGLYLTLPILGYCGDAHGSVFLAIIGSLIIPGYWIAEYQFKNLDNNVLIMSFAFFLIGMGTSSSYFSSLLTCAKIYPNKSISISLPVACYGVSAFLLSWISSLSLFENSIGDESSFELSKFFEFLQWIYLIVTIINWMSSFVVTIEKEIIFAKLIEEEENDAINDNININEEHKLKFKKFLKSYSMPIVLISLLFLSGPLELFIANLSTISNPGSELTELVSIFSISSTIARFLIGFLNDFIGNSIITSIRLILITSIITSFGYYLLFKGYNDDNSSSEGLITIITILMGSSYGSVFTLFPTLVSNIWGVEIFGSAWGLFLCAPAIGGGILGIIYAIMYERGLQRYGFLILSLITLLGGGAIIIIKRLNKIESIESIDESANRGSTEDIEDNERRPLLL